MTNACAQCVIDQIAYHTCRNDELYPDNIERYDKFGE